MREDPDAQCTREQIYFTGQGRRRVNNHGFRSQVIINYSTQTEGVLLCLKHLLLLKLDRITTAEMLITQRVYCKNCGLLLTIHKITYFRWKQQHIPEGTSLYNYGIPTSPLYTVHNPNSNEVGTLC